MRVSWSRAKLKGWGAIEWHGDDRLSIEGVTFRLTISDFAMQSTAKDFALLKTRGCLETLRTLLNGDTPRDILDIGIHQGGSTALFDLLFNPDRLVAIDNRAAVPALDEYIASRQRTGRVVPYYGQDQGDRAAIRRILAEHFALGLDLVVDDASHQYELTRATFECAFPLLRHGGWYVLEDWGWNHWPGVWQEQAVITGLPLSRLVLELVVAQAADTASPALPKLIDEVRIIGNAAAIRRNYGAWPQDRDFDLDDLLQSRQPVLVREERTTRQLGAPEP